MTTTDPTACATCGHMRIGHDRGTVGACRVLMFGWEGKSINECSCLAYVPPTPTPDEANLPHYESGFDAGFCRCGADWPHVVSTPENADLLVDPFAADLGVSASDAVVANGWAEDEPTAERDAARSAVRAIAARCWMLRQVARESDTALRAEREEVARLRQQNHDYAARTDKKMAEWQRKEALWNRARDAVIKNAETWDLDHVPQSEKDKPDYHPWHYISQNTAADLIALAAERDAAIARAEAAEAAIAAVRALCSTRGEDAGYDPGSWEKSGYVAALLDVRRVLDTGATTAETPLIADHPGCFCSCHGMPGVAHVVPCCNRPPFRALDTGATT